MSITLTVCCLTYNQDKFIRNCLEGFVNQITDFEYEIIVHDDASTDNTTKIVREFESLYPNKLKCIYQKENQFLKQNVLFNILIKSSKGKYIAYCEGDDYWTDPNKLQKQVDLMEKTKSDFCYSDFNIYYQEKGEFEENIFEKKLANINVNHPLLTSGSLGVPTWVFSSDFLKSFNPDKHKLSDKAALMLVEFLRTNGKVCYLPESTAVYRRNLNSSSNQEDSHKRYLHHKLSFEFMLEYFEMYYLDDYQTRCKINNLAVNILSEAHDHQDLDLINRIKSFLLQSEIDITQILNKFHEHDKFKSNYESLDNSKLRRLIKRFKR